MIILSKLQLIYFDAVITYGVMKYAFYSFLHLSFQSPPFKEIYHYATSRSDLIYNVFPF